MAKDAVNYSNTTSFAMLKQIIMSLHEASLRQGEWPMRPILLRGPHGIGKTECVRELGEMMGMPVLGLPTNKMTVIEKRAAQLSDGDLLGIPYVVDGPVDENGNSFGKVTAYAPPQWLALACVQPCIVFLDELDRAANKSVEQGLFQMADSKRLGDAVLHPRSIIIAAINGGIHEGAAKGRYKVSMMDAASLSRWAVFDFAPTAADWFEWALRTKNGEQNVTRMITDFIQSHPGALNENWTDNMDPGAKTCDRRAWGLLSKALKANGWNDADALEKDNVFPAFQSLCQAYLGTSTGASFAAFARTYRIRLTIADIENGRFTKQRLEQISPADKIGLAEGLVSKYFGVEMSPEMVTHFCRFFTSVDAETASKALRGKLASQPSPWASVNGLTGEARGAQLKNVAATNKHEEYPLNKVLQATAG